MRKIPPWGYALGAIGLGAAFWYYKKHKEEKELAESTTSEVGTTEVPYSGEPEGYPYSVGGGGGGLAGGAVGNPNETAQEFHELFGNIQSFEKESAQGQSEFDKSIAQSIAESNKSVGEILKGSFESLKNTTIAAGGGGGAPSSPGPGGTTTAQPPPTAAPSCPSAFPEYNPARGPVGEHSCYRQSRTKSGGGCGCHGYQDGKLECEHGKAPHCAW